VVLVVNPTTSRDEEVSVTNPIRRTQLDSGLRVVTESLPHLRSASVAFWVGTGARDEIPGLAGASHFLEHLLFKGTATRDAQEIATAVESVGGDMNAFTAHEYTAFYVRVPDAQLAMAIEILSDIVWSPAFRPDEVDSERQVILEEIRMREDAPDDLVHDLLAGIVFPEHPLGREVIGFPETVESATPEVIAAFHAEHYHPGNVVVAVAGNIAHDEVLALVERGLGGRTGDRPTRDLGALSDAKGHVVLDRPLEQAHIALGLRGIARGDPDRWAFGVLNQVLGGGMSSRLFQEIREKRGLAYSVYSYRASFEETGAFAVYVGSAPERVDESLAIARAEIDRLVRERSVTEAELVAAKGYLTGSLALSLESSTSRMHRIGRSELLQHEVPELDDLVAAINGVGPDDIARVIDRVFVGSEPVLAAIGPFDDGAFAA
jgi:predicted Zn-dependent peptidase